MFEAQKYGGYFVTTDKRILSRAGELKKRCGISILVPSDFLAGPLRRSDAGNEHERQVGHLREACSRAPPPPAPLGPAGASTWGTSSRPCAEVIMPAAAIQRGVGTSSGHSTQQRVQHGAQGVLQPSVVAVARRVARADRDLAPRHAPARRGAARRACLWCPHPRTRALSASRHAGARGGGRCGRPRAPAARRAASTTAVISAAIPASAQGSAALTPKRMPLDQAGQRDGQQEPAGDTRPRHPRRLPQHQPDHIGAARAQRQAHADLVGPAPDGVGQHAVDAQARQEQRLAREQPHRFPKKRCSHVVSSRRPPRPRSNTAKSGAASPSACADRRRLRRRPGPRLRRTSSAISGSPSRAYGMNTLRATGPVSSPNSSYCRSGATPTTRSQRVPPAVDEPDPPADAPPSGPEAPRQRAVDDGDVRRGGLVSAAVERAAFDQGSPSVSNSAGGSTIALARRLLAGRHGLRRRPRPAPDRPPSSAGMLEVRRGARRRRAARGAAPRARAEERAGLAGAVVRVARM